MGKTFIFIGIIFIVIGVIWSFIGRLPGDLQFKVGNVSVHLPIMTSIVVSVVLSLIFYVIGKFR